MVTVLQTRSVVYLPTCLQVDPATQLYAPKFEYFGLFAFTFWVSESVARHRACVLILTGVTMSHEQHGLLKATVL